MKNESEDVLIELRAQMDQIHKTIDDLNAFFPNEHHINIANALRKANEYLEEIQKKFEEIPNGQEALNCARYNNHNWENEAKIANNLQNSVKSIEDETEVMNFRLDDLRNHSHNVFKIVTETQGVQSKNLENFDKLKSRYAEIDTIRMDIDDMLDNNLLLETEQFIYKINDTLYSNPSINPSNMKHALTDMLDRIEDNEIETKDLSISVVTKAQIYAEELDKKSKDYSALFQDTRDGAEAALRARFAGDSLIILYFLFINSNSFYSSAHKNITSAIEAASEAANRAEDEAFKTHAVLYPTHGPTIADNSSKSLVESIELKTEALIEIEKLEGELI